MDKIGFRNARVSRTQFAWHAGLQATPRQRSLQRGYLIRIDD